MLFNSYTFLFAFLPVTILCFSLLSRNDRSGLALIWLVAASLFFYGWWNPRYLLLLGASVVVNYSLGAKLAKAAAAGAPRKAFLVFGVVFNIGLIAYFKYAGFLAGAANDVLGLGFNPGDIVLPLAISFYTFQQIAFLVDAYQGKAGEGDFVKYALFVTFFPQLIAGPIVHHGEVMGQYDRAARRGLSAANAAVGFTILFIGLFKKVIIADQMATYASPMFGAAAAGDAPGFVVAWGGALAYTLQIYFDFSGYSDMAVGLARIFGVRLPVNFFSPYRTTSIIDFWRRWHMTLSRFLMAYLYIPLGGNRLGPFRRHANIMITMLLGGLWHGAAWTFVVWGGLHGVYLVINHAWRAARRFLGWSPTASSVYGRALSWLLTFLSVVVAWVFFRAESFTSALVILKSMAGLNDFFTSQDMAPLKSRQARWIAGLLIVVVFAPNTYEIMARYKPVLGAPARSARRWTAKIIQWRPTPVWGVLSAITAVIAVLGLTRVTEFLYFQF